MKITQLGKIPQVKVYPVVCGYCSTQFEFLPEEARELQKGEFLGIDCPLCKKEVRVVADKFEMKEEAETKVQHNKIVAYILANWDTLPKSTFGGEECVIFDCAHNEDYGYGNHSYEGYGVDRQGNIVCGSSSGCSCNGSCCLEPYTVSLDNENSLKFDNYNPETIDFGSLQVDFSEY
jgi:hypothetical protein